MVQWVLANTHKLFIPMIHMAFSSPTQNDDKWTEAQLCLNQTSTGKRFMGTLRHTQATFNMQVIKYITKTVGLTVNSALNLNYKRYDSVYFSLKCSFRVWFKEN